MLDEGADFLDIGGYSSRPGAEDINAEEELERVLKPIESLKKEFPNCIISIDTFRSAVAEEAVAAGADLVNDISGGQLDPEMIPAVSRLGVPYIAMHMRGTPQTMKELTIYEDLIGEITKYFSGVIRQCEEAGIKDVIIDPGFGFAKTIDQNFELLNGLEYFKWLERPILVGLSRKSLIYKTLNLSSDEALNGTTTLNTLALFKGAGILRVHDIREAVEVVKLVTRLT